MPYDSIGEATKKNKGLEKYSDKAKRGWVGSFNSCMKDGGPEDKCFAIAYSVANKVDGRKPKESKMNEQAIVREMMAAVHELKDVEPRLAMGILQEVKAIKLKAVVQDFFKNVGRFKGDINKLLKELDGMVKNPRALAAFPELADILDLSKYLKKGVLKHTFMRPDELMGRMQQVVTLDA